MTAVTRPTFSFVDSANPEIYTLSLHDALPICRGRGLGAFKKGAFHMAVAAGAPITMVCVGDRKSTRLNSSHVRISYAVFCLEKKNPHACRAAVGVARTTASGHRTADAGSHRGG